MGYFLKYAVFDPMSRRLRFYTWKFIWKKKAAVYAIQAAVFCGFLDAMGKLGKQWIANVIFYSDPMQASDINKLYQFVGITVAHMAISLFLKVLSYHFETSRLADIFTYVYAKFIQYQHADWKKQLRCDLYTAIIRRAKGTTQFYHQLFIVPIEFVFYFLLGSAKLLFFYGLSSHLILGFILATIFPFALNLLTLLRTKALRKKNIFYEHAEKQLKDIFLNYEMIHTYNYFDQEIANYKKAYGGWQFWFTVYWIIDSLMRPIYKMLKDGLIIILFYQTNGLGLPRKTQVDQLKTFNSILKRIHNYTTSVKLTVEASENMLHSNLDNLVVASVPQQSRPEFTTAIEAVDLKMQYGNQLIFEGVNLWFQRGEKIAITGPNGSGKSTFIRALLGLEKFEGRLLIDGIDRQNLQEASLGQLISYVPQDTTMFEATVIDNITLFDRKHPREEVIKKIKEYGMHEEISSVGYETLLVEKGKNISSAQRQKICFLRAVLRDAPIVIFDEMTSEMDEEYEACLIDLIMRNMAEKTIVMIIHNMALMDKFDKVVFFNNRTAQGGCMCKEMVEKSVEFKSFCSHRLKS